MNTPYRSELHAALAPADPVESTLVDWLAADITHPEMLITMVARQVGVAYDRGWSEGLEHRAGNTERPSGDINPTDMGQHGWALLNDPGMADRSSWYWAGYRDGLAAR